MGSDQGIDGLQIQWLKRNVAVLSCLYYYRCMIGLTLMSVNLTMFHPKLVFRESFVRRQGRIVVAAVQASIDRRRSCEFLDFESASHVFQDVPRGRTGRPNETRHALAYLTYCISVPSLGGKWALISSRKHAATS